MPTLTDVRNEISKALESTQVSKPLYAVAGVGDLAIEKFRDAEKRVRELHIDQRIAGLGENARSLPGRVQHAQSDVQGRVRELPSTVIDAALAASGRATGMYEDLSVRGKKLVDGLAVQRPVTITDAPAKASTATKSNGTAKPRAKSASATSSAAKSSSAKSGAAKKTAAKKTTKATAKK